jgi:hypothetical protein
MEMGEHYSMNFKTKRHPQIAKIKLGRYQKYDVIRFEDDEGEP